MKAGKHPQESLRIAALQDLNILDTRNEEEFDELVEIASSICNTPISLISLVDAERQWFKARLGLQASETSLQESVCAHAILTDETLVIDDTLLDPRTVDNPLVHNDVNMRFYAGVPLKVNDELPIGTLCVLDTVPRQLSPDQLRALEVLGRQVMMRMTLRSALGRERELKQQLEQQRDELLHMNERLIAEDKSKNLFLAMLSHELRNPLSAMSNGLSLLDTVESADQQQDTLQMMHRQCGQLTRLLDDLLDVSRISRGKISLKPDKVSLAPILDDAVDTLRADAAAKQIELNLVNVPGQLHVRADAARLLQVIINLLNNAIRYTPAGGQVSLKALQNESEVQIHVRDSGQGICEEDLPRVFDFFVQLENRAGTANQGLGLGLALVHELVHLHGGSVSVHSDGPDRGSTFSVTLPLVTPQGPASRTQAAEDTAPDSSVIKVLDILITDDNIDSISALGRLLKRRRHTVRLAESGKQAMQAVKDRQPDVILLDIGLPDICGHDLARHFRQSAAGLPLLLVATTGYGQDEDRKRSQQAGFDHHLTKPIDLSLLNRHLDTFARELADSTTRSV